MAKFVPGQGPRFTTTEVDMMRLVLEQTALGGDVFPKVRYGIDLAVDEFVELARDEVSADAARLLLHGLGLRALDPDFAARLPDEMGGSYGDWIRRADIPKHLRTMEPPPNVYDTDEP